MIANVLASRLASVIDKIISPNQSAFFKNRQLVDGVVVVNKVVDLAKKSKKDCLIFKVNFEKDCDSMSWTFYWNIC